MADDMTQTLRWWISHCHDLERDLDIQRALNIQMQDELASMEYSLNRQLSTHKGTPQ